MKNLAALRAAERRTHGDSWVSEVAFSWCSLTPRGAWAIMLNKILDAHDYETIASWSLVHFDVSGVRIEVAPEMPTRSGADPKYDLANSPTNYESAVGGFTPYIYKPKLFDFNGDGEPELFLRLTNSSAEQGTWTRGRLWSFRDGKITLYGPSTGINIEKMDDFDNDGRPDLLTYGPYDMESEMKYSSFPYRATGVLLAARSMPDGSFSFSDPEAVKRTALSCAETTRELLVVTREDLSIDVDMSLSAIVCARLRGAQKDTLISSLRAEYDAAARKSPHYPELETGDVPQIFEDWIAIDPPVRIPMRSAPDSFDPPSHLNTL